MTSQSSRGSSVPLRRRADRAGPRFGREKNYRRRLGAEVIAKDLREEHDATGSNVTCAERVRSRRFEESSADLFGNRLLALKSPSGLCREGQAEWFDP